MLITNSDREKFERLVKKPVKKKRLCIKCYERTFISNNSGHRYCSICSQQVETLGERAEYVSSDHKYSSKF